jgi:predicted GNAT family acetyltransferase
METFDKPIPNPDLPEGCTIEVVKTEEMMEAFNEVVCTTFGIDGESKNLYKKGLWDLATKEPYSTCHWVAKKNGIVVSALTSFIQGSIVSFWNEASVPEIRRHGYSTAIVKTALQDAMSKGCKSASAYLMPDCLALGIYTRLGYKTKWRFNAFLYKLKE